MKEHHIAFPYRDALLGHRRLNIGPGECLGGREMIHFEIAGHINQYPSRHHRGDLADIELRQPVIEEKSFPLLQL